MIRENFKQSTIENNHGQFRFRGTDNTRIEAYSDGVFAIATALLIISTSVPQTYRELIIFLDDLTPFALCITLLMLIWHEHYIFFLRYGFKDAGIVAVNTLFLFLVLFYIYPLKFLFALLYKLFTGIATSNKEALRDLFTNVIEVKDAPTLMVIYGIGAAAIFFTLAWMYYIAYLRRHKLDLNEVEVFDTKEHIIENLIMAIVPVISILLALTISHNVLAFRYSGMIYMSYGILMPAVGVAMKRKRKKLLARVGPHENTAEGTEES